MAYDEDVLELEQEAIAYRARITTMENEIRRLRSLLKEAAEQLRRAGYPVDWDVAERCAESASTHT